MRKVSAVVNLQLLSCNRSVSEGRTNRYPNMAVTHDLWAEALQHQLRELHSEMQPLVPAEWLRVHSLC